MSIPDTMQKTNARKRFFKLTNETKPMAQIRTVTAIYRESISANRTATCKVKSQFFRKAKKADADVPDFGSIRVGLNSMQPAVQKAKMTRNVAFESKPMIRVCLTHPRHLFRMRTITLASW